MSKAKAKKETIICLIGPTAVGKTEIALRLAKKIDAEIISCDSMQIYKGIEIASSKPTKRQRKEVPHHLIDIVHPTQEYNAARFRSSAQRIIQDVHKRGKLPLIVCGTGLYLRALLDGLFVGPGQNRTLRKKLYQQAKRYGPKYLYQRLKRLDIQAARKIHPHDLRRIIRALEVGKLCGQPISQLQKKCCGIRNEYKLFVFGLERPRPLLYERIDIRVERMFRRGLVAEIKRLKTFRLSKTAKSLLGYKEIKGFLDGEYTCAQAKELLKKNTRHYAKRQLSWFRREKEVNWIEVGQKDTPELIAERINSSLV